MGTRRYRQQARAQAQDETRRRIVEATAALHAEVGPAATTISAIAARAGVQRLTVYRHFPDDAALFAACTAHAVSVDPPPDPGAWAAISHPPERVLAALDALYGYYARRGSSLGNVLRDVDRVPALAVAMEPMAQAMDAMRTRLREGWPTGGDAGVARRLDAAIALALDFGTWRTLAARGLAPDDAARLMQRLVCASAACVAASRCAEPPSPSGSPQAPRP